MINSFDFLDFVNKSTETKLAITTSHKLNLFLAEVNKISSNDSYSTKDEDENDPNFESDFFGIMNVSSEEEDIPSISLKEEKTEDDFFAHYFNSCKNKSSKNEFRGQKRKLFKVNYRKRSDEFHDIEEESSSKEKIFLENKVLPTIKRRRENQDNIRKKLKTVFFNNFLRKKINEILRRKQSRKYFEKFPISFVNDIRKNTNKDIINISLLEIIMKKELYNEKDLRNYEHNLKVIKNEETLENEELKEILNKKYCELFEEYLNSKEFNVDEINRLKNNNLEDIYIKRYIYQSKHYIEYFAE
jgi:hypothetical protein